MKQLQYCTYFWVYSYRTPWIW